MAISMKSNILLSTLLPMLFMSTCLAQTDNDDAKNETLNGRFLLDLSYTNTDAYEGTVNVFSPGFTWLVGPDLRVGAVTTFMTFDPKRTAEFGNTDSSNGLGDSLLFVQYDWDERLTASPWIPANVGMNVSLLVPTGDLSKSLSLDTWGLGISVSWPIVNDSGWLFNPVIGYDFTFSEGAAAEQVKAAQIGVGIVKLFPSKFWMGYTPIYWYDFEKNRSNYDGYFTVGKMFSNGMGIGLEYGIIARNSQQFSQFDETLLLNFYYQFGQRRHE